MTRDEDLPCAPPSRRSALQVIVAAFPAALPGMSPPAGSSAVIDEQADRALAALYTSSDNALELSARASAVLVFARVANTGMVLDGQEGEGVMRIAGASAAYYRIVGAPPAAGAGQPFSLAFFFVTPSAFAYLGRSGCWDVGRGLSLRVAGAGFGRILNTTTLTEDVYAVPFGQRGLMAGLGLEGSRIFRIHPSHDLS
jgi:lipid-binding SYLF domain-containing protein